MSTPGPHKRTNMLTAENAIRVFAARNTARLALSDSRRSHHSEALRIVLDQLDVIANQLEGYESQPVVEDEAGHPCPYCGEEVSRGEIDYCPACERVVEGVVA